jgi:hypothetical protein
MRAFALLLLALVPILAGCGGDDGGGGEQDAKRLLERGFSTDVDSGEIHMEMELAVDGVKGADAPFRLELSGPFRSRGPTEMPDVDGQISASGQGASFEGRVVLLPRNAWIEYGGETYEVGRELWTRAQESLNREGGPETFAQAGVDPLDWISDAETDGTAEVSGATTTKVTGELSVAAMLRDFNSLSPDSAAIPRRTLAQIDDSIDAVEFAAWIGEDDIWRRLSCETSFTVPEGEREEGTGGIEGGRVSLEMTLTAPNEPVSIEGPGEGRPISELLRALGIPPQLLLGPGFEVPVPG